MNPIISQFISEWGTLGAVLCAIAWFAYENWKSNKNKSSHKNETIDAVNNLGDKIENLQEKIFKLFPSNFLFICPSQHLNNLLR